MAELRRNQLLEEIFAFFEPSKEEWAMVDSLYAQNNKGSAINYQLTKILDKINQAKKEAKVQKEARKESILKPLSL